MTLYIIWKLIYFGQILPATYIAKAAPLSLITFIKGLVRLIGFLSINGNFFLAALFLAAIAYAIKARYSVRSGFWYVIVTTAIHLIYLLSLGFRISMDDAYRFYVSLVILASILMIEFISLVSNNIVRYLSIWITGSIVCLSILIPLRYIDLWHAWWIDMNWGIFSYQISASDEAYGLERGHIALGRYLKEHAHSESTIVLSDAGAIPYFSGLRTIDTGILTDPYLIKLRKQLSEAKASDRENILREMREYVLSQNPDFIIQNNLSFLEDPEVLARYEPMGIEFIYYEAYKCGRQRFCSYVLKPWKRRDIR